MSDDCPLIEWADRVGITAEDFSEVLDRSLILATRLDVRLKSLVSRQGIRQAHNEDVIRVLASAFLLQWMLDEAAFDWGWDTGDFEPGDMMGEMLITGLDFLQANRVQLQQEDDDDGQ